MSQRVTIDSCVFVSALNKNEEYSEKSLRFLDKVHQGKYIAIVPVTVLIETVAAIRRRTNSDLLASKAKEFILSIENLSFVDVDYSRCMEMIDFVSANAFRGMDALIVWVAKEFECKLVTLDKEIVDLVKKIKTEKINILNI